MQQILGYSELSYSAGRKPCYTKHALSDEIMKTKQNVKILYITRRTVYRVVYGS